MGFLTRGIKALTMEDPAQPLMPYSALSESLGLGKSDAGVMVNEKQAMRLTAAFACIKIISEDISSLPFGIFQRMPDGSTREATEHSLYKLVHDQPNEKMSSMTFRGALLTSVLGWGNGYALIRRDKAARVVSMDLLPADKTHPMLDDNELFYVTTATKDGMPVGIPKENMLHIQGLSLDGMVGLSPIGTCKNAFGLSLAAEKFGAQFFGNGARATGVFKHPGELDAEAYENLKKSIREQMTGESSLRPLILEEGMDWSQIAIAPNDAQFLETRQFQTAEIARLYRVAMHLLQDLQRATNNNIEHQSLDHLRYCLRPWAIRIEQEYNRKLLKGTFYTQHDFNDFQRGDFASQTAGWNLLRTIGVYSANDVLKAMHQNPIPASEGGDVRIVPMNMVTLEAISKQKELPSAGGGEPDKEEGTDSDEGTPITDKLQSPIVASFRRLFRDAVGRITNRKEHDEHFSYRAVVPIVAAMAQAILGAAGLGTDLREEDSEFVGTHAKCIAEQSSTWNKARATAIANDETEATYLALVKKLLGES